MLPRRQALNMDQEGPRASGSSFWSLKLGGANFLWFMFFVLMK